MDQPTKFDEVWSVIEQVQTLAPILELKNYAAPSVLLPENMVREARRHYLAPSRYAGADPALMQPVMTALLAADQHVNLGATWTTDASFRATGAAIMAARAAGIMAVEMEAVDLYAFAKAYGGNVLCFAHITNQMGQIDGDFEKGETNGVDDALGLIVAARVAMDVGR
jgi:purine-nucleoside phosphorylase